MEANEKTVSEIAESLRLTAVEKWGEERPAALAGVIDQTARDIWRVERQPPSLDEEPESNT